MIPSSMTNSRTCSDQARISSRNHRPIGRRLNFVSRWAFRPRGLSFTPSTLPTISRTRSSRYPRQWWTVPEQGLLRESSRRTSEDDSVSILQFYLASLLSSYTRLCGLDYDFPEPSGPGICHDEVNNQIQPRQPDLPPQTNDDTIWSATSCFLLAPKGAFHFGGLSAYPTLYTQMVKSQ